KEFSLRRTVEVQPTRDIGRIGNEELNVETKVRNFAKVSFQHLAITRYPDAPPVVDHFIMNEPMQIRPVLLVQAGNVVTVDAGEIVLRHRHRACVSTRPLLRSSASA